MLLLERESQPGYHTTGRSAALFTETYGDAVKRALSRASKPFLQQPPDGFTSMPLVTPRGTLLAATEDRSCPDCGRPPTTVRRSSATSAG